MITLGRSSVTVLVFLICLASAVSVGANAGMRSAVVKSLLLFIVVC